MKTEKLFHYHIAFSCEKGEGMTTVGLKSKMKLGADIKDIVELIKLRCNLQKVTILNWIELTGEETSTNEEPSSSSNSTHDYFISFSHDSGKGSYEMSIPYEINCKAHIESIKEYLESQSVVNPVILNWIKFN